MNLLHVPLGIPESWMSERWGDIVPFKHELHAWDDTQVKYHFSSVSNVCHELPFLLDT